MFLRSPAILAVLVLAVASTTGLADHPNWKPTLGDANEFEDAADDFHDRARTLRDPSLIAVAAQFENTTEQLERALKSNRCIDEVLPLLDSSYALLSQSANIVAYSCQLREDRKLVDQLERSARAFASLNNRVRFSLEPQSPVLRSPIGAAPAWVEPVPSYPSSVPNGGSPYQAVPSWNGPALPPSSTFPGGSVQPNYYVPQSIPSWTQPPVQYDVRYSRPAQSQPTLRFRIADLRL